MKSRAPVSLIIPVELPIENGPVTYMEEKVTPLLPQY